MDNRSRITLGNTTFFLDEEEVIEIKDYLNVVKSYFAKSDNLHAIIEVRENMIADILEKRGRDISQS
tara:strand:+ start:301 stop:501 length:201 start_codon:yes stop_codon:yes gene_type:complete